MANYIVAGFDPAHGYGLSKAARLVILGLTQLGHSVDFFGIETKQPYKSEDGLFRAYPYAALKEATPHLQGQAIITIGDLWLFEDVGKITEVKPLPWIAYMGCEGITYPNRVFTGGREFINLRELLNRVSCVWGYTTASQKVFQSFAKCDVLPHSLMPIHENDKRELDLRKLLKIPSEKKLALLICDNSLRKGIPDFINAIANNEEWVGYIHAPTYKLSGYDLEALTAGKDNIFIRQDLGRVTNRLEFSDNEIASLYNQCDLYLHPHSAEGFGLTVLEALANENCKVLATDTAGPSTYLPSKCKIPISEIIYLQFPGVGYYAEKPGPIDLTAGDKYFNMKGYRFNDFKENLEKLLKIEYIPQTWRNA